MYEVVQQGTRENLCQLFRLVYSVSCHLGMSEEPQPCAWEQEGKDRTAGVEKQAQEVYLQCEDSNSRAAKIWDDAFSC